MTVQVSSEHLYYLSEAYQYLLTALFDIRNAPLYLSSAVDYFMLLLRDRVISPATVHYAFRRFLHVLSNLNVSEDAKRTIAELLGGYVYSRIPQCDTDECFESAVKALEELRSRLSELEQKFLSELVVQ